jgi:hypothetical protein
VIDPDHVAPRRDVERRTKPRGNGSRSRYESWTTDELYDEARKARITGRSQMSRQQLIDALRGRRLDWRVS